MKKLICLLLLLSFSAQATCDFSTGISPGPNSTFVYTKECHEAVGDLVQANKDLTKVIELKDLALKDSDARILLWKNDAVNQLERMNKLEADQNTSRWLSFGLGVATTFLSAWALSKAISR